MVAEEIGGGEARAMLVVRCQANSAKASWPPPRRTRPLAKTCYDSDGGAMSITLAKSKRHWPAVAGFAVGTEYGGAQFGYVGFWVVAEAPPTPGRTTLPGELLPGVRS